MPTARVTAIADGSRHLILSNCPVCDHAHESALHAAEAKFRVRDDFYPFWADCPNSPVDVLLIRFVDRGGRFDIGMVALHREDPIFRLGPCPPRAGRLL